MVLSVFSSARRPAVSAPAGTAWSWWLAQAAEHAAPATDDDERDVALARRGDEEAFARLVRRHQRGVARLLWRFTRDPDEQADLLQDVFIAAWTTLARYRGTGSFAGWLRRIAVRTGYRLWRARRHALPLAAEPVDLGELPDAALTTASHAEVVAAAETVHALLARLSERDRLVLTLLHLEGCSVEEIAAATGWSSSLVKVQAWRARRRLRALLEET
jgi:RNA polymerase sigma-70 factor (ECF subfamily)